MIYAGIDASSSMTGIGIFDNLKLIFYEKIRPQKDLGYRNNACQIVDIIAPMLNKYKVEKIYMEDVPEFVKQGSKGKNVLKTLAILGCVQGVFYQKLRYENNFDIEFIHVHKWRERMGFLKGKQKCRDDQKQKAVDFVNNTFGINLKYTYGKKLVSNDDDIAEAICIVWSQIGLNQIE